jgi:hypothetical protein
MKKIYQQKKLVWLLLVALLGVGSVDQSKEPHI